MISIICLGSIQIRTFFAPFVLLVVLLLSSSPSGATSRRVALVIGNSAYQHAPALKNPKNDAAAIATALKELGFDVVLALDKKYADMSKVLSAFYQKVQSAETALLYYSGHGLQIKGQNYLIPVDAAIESEIDVQFQTVRLDRILNIMQSGPQTSLIFLDACRDNPLARSLARSLKTRSSLIGRGLAQLSARAGMLVAYSTAPGNVAADGQGKLSPFTSAVLKHIKTPRLDVTALLRRVRVDVMKETQNEQVPWTNSSLTNDFVFNDRTDGKRTDGKREGRDSKSSSGNSSSSPLSGEQYAWNATSQIGTCGAYRHFANSYKTSFYAGLAKDWISHHCQQPMGEGNGPKEDRGPVRARDASPTTPPDSKRLARQLQRELKRLGCLEGTADGIWGAGSRRAATRYNHYASLKIPVEAPTADALERLQNQDRKLCPQAPSFARQLTGRWNCTARTKVFLAQSAFLMRKGKQVQTENCQGTLQISPSGKNYHSRFDQKCRTTNLLTFGTPPEKASWIKAKLWFKEGKLLSKAYQMSLPKKMISGWNPTIEYRFTDNTLNAAASGIVKWQGIKYQYKMQLICHK